MLKIYLDEEYGYREWVWFFPGTKEEILTEWKTGHRPISASPDIKGTVSQIFFKRDPSKSGKEAFTPFLFSLESNEEGDPINAPFDARGNLLGIPIEGVSDMTFFDGFGHVHEKNDTYLEIDEKVFRDEDQDEE